MDWAIYRERQLRNAQRIPDTSAWDRNLREQLRVRDGGPTCVLENELKTLLSTEDQPTIVLRAEKSVPVENVVGVMDIANRNKFKVILAVKPN